VTSTARRAHAAAAERIGAPPAAVYAVLADYRTHHPRIMPAPPFSDLRVEQGGTGAGTVFRIDVGRPGRPSTLHMRVAEPEPGRVLTETDLDTGAVTAFTVTPQDGGTLARMATEWDPPPGLRGALSRAVEPALRRRLMTRQLRQLAHYVRDEEIGREPGTETRERHDDDG